MGWADLEPWDRRARLARVHPRLKEDCLIAAGRSIPELRPEIDAQKSKEDRLRVVLRHFGDERHPNPGPENPPKHGPAIDGNIAAHDCPPWERLPPLKDDEPAAIGKPRRRAERGRTEAEVWRSEADKVARIYMRDRGRTPYAVWAHYNPGRVRQAENPKLLSRNMVVHLIEAIDRGWLGWNASRRRLRISDEFRTSQTRFVIPRRKPAS